MIGMTIITVEAGTVIRHKGKEGVVTDTTVVGHDDKVYMTEAGVTALMRAVPPKKEQQ